MGNNLRLLYQYLSDTGTVAARGIRQPVNVTGVKAFPGADIVGGTHTLTYDYIGTASKTLAWGTGAAVDVTAGGRFTLDGGTAAGHVSVDVTATSLPGADCNDALVCVATDTAAGYGVENAYDGHQHTEWRSTSTATASDSHRVSLTFDAGTGATHTADSLVLACADALITRCGTANVLKSADGLTWTSVTSLPLTSSALAQDGVKHYYAALASFNARFVALEFAGLLSLDLRVAGAYLGTAVELAQNPKVGVEYIPESYDATFVTDGGSVWGHSIGALPGSQIKMDWDNLATSDWLILKAYWNAVRGGKKHWMFAPSATGVLIPGVDVLKPVALMGPMDFRQNEYRKWAGGFTWREDV